MSNESTFGKRMQGPKHEGDASLALAILKGRTSLREEMKDPEWVGIDWEHVKHFIALHRHEYPDYKGE